MGLTRRGFMRWLGQTIITPAVQIFLPVVYKEGNMPVLPGNNSVFVSVFIPSEVGYGGGTTVYRRGDHGVQLQDGVNTIVSSNFVVPAGVSSIKITPVVFAGFPGADTDIVSNSQLRIGQIGTEDYNNHTATNGTNTQTLTDSRYASLASVTAASVSENDMIFMYFNHLGTDAGNTAAPFFSGFLVEAV